MKNNKRSLFILKYLTEQTDENHLATITNINEYLRQYDLDANRETISDCIKELQDVGYDIGICLRSYFVQQRQKILNAKAFGIFTFSLFTFHSSLNSHSGFQVISKSE